MPTEDEDVALSLPQPPPPAPARREAAIDKALHHFDAGGAVSHPVGTRNERPPAGSWWGKTNRPQLGVLVAAALVAVIGLPAAWVSITRQTSGPAAEMALHEPEAFPTFDVAPNAPPNSAAPEQSARTEEHSSAARAKIAADAPAERGPAAVAVAQPEAEVQPPATVATRQARSSADNEQHSRTATGLAEARLAPPAMMAEAAPLAASPAPAPPPPPPSATAQNANAEAKKMDSFAAGGRNKPAAMARARTDDRSTVDQAAWNACTINDPARSLSACRQLIKPGAKGSEGRAAAHLADGLSLAWQGDIDRAIAALDRAIAIAPKMSAAYLNRGLAYQRQGDTRRALSDLDQAVRLAPRMAQGYYSRSQVLRQRGDVARANADRARAMALDADDRAAPQ